MFSFAATSNGNNKKDNRKRSNSGTRGGRRARGRGNGRNTNTRGGRGGSSNRGRNNQRNQSAPKPNSSKTTFSFTATGPSSSSSSSSSSSTSNPRHHSTHHQSTQQAVGILDEYHQFLPAENPRGKAAPFHSSQLSNQIEEQFIIRLPSKLESYLSAAVGRDKVPRDDYIIINYRRDCGPRAFQLQLNIPGHKDKWYAATLRDLPTRVETHKTWDNGETLFKVADVAQVLIVEAISKEYLYPNDFPQYDDVTLDDGISPHTKNITNTRYRWAKEAKIPPLIAKTKSKETTSSSSSSSSKVWESDSDEEEDEIDIDMPFDPELVRKTELLLYKMIIDENELGLRNEVVEESFIPKEKWMADWGDEQTTDWLEADVGIMNDIIARAMLRAKMGGSWKDQEEDDTVVLHNRSNNLHSTSIQEPALVTEAAEEAELIMPLSSVIPLGAFEEQPLFMGDDEGFGADIMDVLSMAIDEEDDSGLLDIDEMMSPAGVNNQQQQQEPRSFMDGRLSASPSPSPLLSPSPTPSDDPDIEPVDISQSNDASPVADANQDKDNKNDVDSMDEEDDMENLDDISDDDQDGWDDIVDEEVVEAVEEQTEGGTRSNNNEEDNLDDLEWTSEEDGEEEEEENDDVDKLAEEEGVDNGEKHLNVEAAAADEEENEELKEKERELAKKIKKLQGVKEGIESKKLEIERTENKTMKGKLEKQLTKQEKLKNKLEGKIKVLETEIGSLNESVI